ncbi:MAG: hypothetical protein ACXWKP_26080 [Bradyrhizobium sp.]
MPAARRNTLIARRAPGSRNAVYHFDIHLQGDNETVFFEIWITQIVSFESVCAFDEGRQMEIIRKFIWRIRHAAWNEIRPTVLS